MFHILRISSFLNEIRVISFKQTPTIILKITLQFRETHSLYTEDRKIALANFDPSNFYPQV